MGLKSKLKSFSSGNIPSDHANNKNIISEPPNVQEEEKKRLAQLGNLVVIDYIRSSMDILLNLKIESAMLER